MKVVRALVVSLGVLILLLLAGGVVGMLIGTNELYESWSGWQWGPIFAGAVGTLFGFGVFIGLLIEALKEQLASRLHVSPIGLRLLFMLASLVFVLIVVGTSVTHKLGWNWGEIVADPSLLLQRVRDIPVILKENARGSMGSVRSSAWNLNVSYVALWSLPVFFWGFLPEMNDDWCPTCKRRFTEDPPYPLRANAAVHLMQMLQTRRFGDYVRLISQVRSLEEGRSPDLIKSNTCDRCGRGTLTFLDGGYVLITKYKRSQTRSFEWHTLGNVDISPQDAAAIASAAVQLASGTIPGNPEAQPLPNGPVGGKVWSKLWSSDPERMRRLASRKRCLKAAVMLVVSIAVCIVLGWTTGAVIGHDFYREEIDADPKWLTAVVQTIIALAMTFIWVLVIAAPLVSGIGAVHLSPFTARLVAACGAAIFGFFALAAAVGTRNGLDWIPVWENPRRLAEQFVGSAEQLPGQIGDALGPLWSAQFILSIATPGMIGLGILGFVATLMDANSCCPTCKRRFATYPAVGLVAGSTPKLLAALQGGQLGDYVSLREASRVNAESPTDVIISSSCAICGQGEIQLEGDGRVRQVSRDKPGFKRTNLGSVRISAEQAARIEKVERGLRAANHLSKLQFVEE